MRLVMTLLVPAAGPAAAQPASTTGVVVRAGRPLDRPGQAPRGASTLLIRDGHVAEVQDGHVDTALVEFVMKDGRTVKSPAG